MLSFVSAAPPGYLVIGNLRYRGRLAGMSPSYENSTHRFYWHHIAGL